MLGLKEPSYHIIITRAHKEQAMIQETGADHTSARRDRADGDYQAAGNGLTQCEDQPWNPSNTRLIGQRPNFSIVCYAKTARGRRTRINRKRLLISYESSQVRRCQGVVVEPDVRQTPIEPASGRRVRGMRAVLHAEREPARGGLNMKERHNLRIGEKGNAIEIANDIPAVPSYAVVVPRVICTPVGEGKSLISRAIG